MRRTVWTAAGAWLMAVLVAQASSEVLTYELGPTSVVRFAGHWVPFDFDGTAAQVSGTMAFDTTLLLPVPGDSTEGVALAIPVSSLETGTPIINRAAQTALQVHTHPRITLRIHSACLARRAQPDSSVVHVFGELSMSGITRPVAFIAHVRKSLGARMHVSGTHRVFLSDYQMPHPNFIHFLRVRDMVEVQFDVTYELTVPDDDTPVAKTNSDK
jgi:polyisoprenoid-binding protein YceI